MTWILKKIRILEDHGGILSDDGKNCLKNWVLDTRTKRIERLHNGDAILIGVNKFNNAQPEKNEWNKHESLFGIQELILEHEPNAVGDYHES